MVCCSGNSPKSYIQIYDTIYILHIYTPLDYDFVAEYHATFCPPLFGFNQWFMFVALKKVVATGQQKSNRESSTIRSRIESIWVFPKIGVPQNGWFIMENPIKMDDLWVPLCSETSIYIYILI